MTVSSEADVAQRDLGVRGLPPSHRAATMEALVSARASSASTTHRCLLGSRFRFKRIVASL